MGLVHQRRGQQSHAAVRWIQRPGGAWADYITETNRWAARPARCGSAGVRSSAKRGSRSRWRPRGRRRSCSAGEVGKRHETRERQPRAEGLLQNEARRGTTHSRVEQGAVDLARGGLRGRGQRTDAARVVVGVCVALQRGEHTLEWKGEGRGVERCLAPRPRLQATPSRPRRARARQGRRTRMQWSMGVRRALRATVVGRLKMAAMGVASSLKG